MRSCYVYLDLQGVDFVLRAVDQPIPEGRDPLPIGAVLGVLPIRVLDGVQRLAHDVSGRDLVDLRNVPLAAGNPAILAGLAECVQDSGRRPPTSRCVSTADRRSLGAQYVRPRSSSTLLGIAPSVGIPTAGVPDPCA